MDKGRLLQEDWSEPLETSPNQWQMVKADVSASSQGAVVSNWQPDLANSWQAGLSTFLIHTNPEAGKVHFITEQAAEVGDGTIETCMSLISIPETTYFPHGLLFRFQQNPTTQATSGLGVGFLSNNVVAIGQMVNNQASLLSTPQVVPFQASDWVRIKAVLQGDSVKVYMASGDNPYPVQPTFNVTHSAPEQGLVGFGTYEAEGEFAAVHVDFDCTAFEGNLFLTQTAILERLTTEYENEHPSYQTKNPYFCGNQTHQLVFMEDENPSTYREGYLTYAQLLMQTKQEASFTSMMWYGKAIDWSLMGYSVTDTDSNNNPIPPCNPQTLQNCLGLQYLYHNAKQHPEEYPYGLNIRILVGVDRLPIVDGGAYNKTRQAVLEVLKDFQIPLKDTLDITQNTEWRVEVAYYLNIPTPGRRHSHVKLLVVDAEKAIISGYNVINYDSDLGVVVSGPAAFESQMVFDDLWNTAVSRQIWPGAGLCDPDVDDILVSDFSIHSCHSFYIQAITQHAPPMYAIHPLPQNDFIFSLYRDRFDLTGDRAFADALRVADNHIYVVQDRFSMSSLFLPNQSINQLIVGDALFEAIQNNHLANDPSFRVRLLVDGDPNDLKHSKPAIEDLYRLLENEEIPTDYFEFRISTPRTHMKVAKIDEILVLGSQNWDFSSWHIDGDIPIVSDWVNLAEYNLALDNPSIVNQFNQYFADQWATSQCVKRIESTFWGTEWDTNVTCPYTWFPAGNYQEAATVNLNRRTTIMGHRQTKITKSNSAHSPENTTPIIHITASDVTLADVVLADSSGYAIEIGDGVTPLKNIVISGVVFENNALGAIKLNGPVEVTIENNTFINGDTGIAINHSGVTTGTTIIRNNIFYGQTTHTIRVDSADDGRVLYRHNLFNQCARAVEGVCPTTWLTGNLHPESEMANNLVNVDPLFVDFANHNYNLLPTSPAIDAGAAETRHHLDLDGDGDGVPLPDMGALGYVPAEEFEFTLVLQTPLPNARVATPAVAFTWAWLSDTVPTPAAYHLQIARDGQFTDLVVDNPAVTATELAHSWAGLDNGTYYWRVGHGSAPETWSQIRAFEYQNNPAYLPVLLR